MRHSIALLLAVLVHRRDRLQQEVNDQRFHHSAARRRRIPFFSLAWSEYPSWSVFGVAHEQSDHRR